MNYWASTFVPGDAPFDHTFWGAISAYMAKSVVLENNFVGGAQRSGIFYNGDLCPGVTSIQPGMNHSIQNNIVHCAYSGVTTFPTYTYGSDGTFGSKLTCVSISGFTVFKSVNWGIYYQNEPSVIIDSNILVDNQVSVLSFVLYPNMIQHILSGKTTQISNTIFVGRSSSFDCLNDVVPSDFNAQYTKLMNAYGGGADGNGLVGLTIGNFIGADNGLTRMEPWFVLDF